MVAGPKTRPDAVAGDRATSPTCAWARAWSHCKDTPGFIANRIGIYWIQAAVNAAIDLGLTVEEADAVVGRPIGIPKTGVFGLIDLVGLDLMPHVAKSLLATLPPGRRLSRDPPRAEPLIEKMIADGLHRPQGQGRLLPPRKPRRQRKVKESDRPQDRRLSRRRSSRGWTASTPRKGGLKALVAHRRQDRRNTPGRCWARRWPMPPALVPRDRRRRSSRSMRRCGSATTGSCGPFELIDQLGADWLAERLDSRGQAGAGAAARPRGHGSFYRVEDGKLQYLGTDGDYRRRDAARGRAAAGRHQARRQADRCRTARPRCGTSATASPASSSPAR